MRDLDSDEDFHSKRPKETSNRTARKLPTGYCEFLEMDLGSHNYARHPQIGKLFFGKWAFSVKRSVSSIAQTSPSQCLRFYRTLVKPNGREKSPRRESAHDHEATKASIKSTLVKTSFSESKQKRKTKIRKHDLFRVTVKQRRHPLF